MAEWWLDTQEDEAAARDLQVMLVRDGMGASNEISSQIEVIPGTPEKTINNHDTHP